MANITITNNDVGGVAIEVEGTVEATVQNVEITDQTYAEGTIFSRAVSTGNLIPYVPVALPDEIVDVVHDYPNVPTLQAIDSAVVVPGSLVGDIVDVEPLGVWDVGLDAPEGRCLVAGTVQVRVANVTAADINPASQTFRFHLQHAAESGEPKFVLTYPLTVAASSSAAAILMAAGKVNKNRLVVHAGTALTAEMLDDLLARGIIPVDVKQLAKIDNPQ